MSTSTDTRTDRGLSFVAERPGQPAAWLAVAAAAAGCGAVAWWGAERDPKVALIVAMAALVCVPFFVSAVRRRWDPFEPINLVAVMLLFWFVARPALELSEHMQPYAPYYNAAAGFTPAMIVGLVGTAALYAGYYLRAGARVARWLRPLPRVWDTHRSIRYTYGLLAVGALLELVFLSQIGLPAFLHIYSGRGSGNIATFHSSNAYFELGLYVAIPGSVIALVAWRKRRSFAAGLLLTLCVGISLFLTVRRGDRTFILALILPLLVLWYLERHRRPRVLSILVAFAVFAIAANASASLRVIYPGRPGAGQTLISSLTNPGQGLSSFVRGPDGSEFSVLEVEMHQYQTGALPHWPGSTLASLATGLIPHQLLHAKPLSPLQHVTWTLFPSTAGGGSYGPPVYGSFYADDGWVSLILLSLVVGIGLRTLWEYFLVTPENTGTQLVFAVSLPLVAMLVRADISLAFAAAVVLALPIILCVVTCSKAPLRLGLRLRRAFAR